MNTPPKGSQSKFGLNGISSIGEQNRAQLEVTAANTSANSHRMLSSMEHLDGSDGPKFAAKTAWYNQDLTNTSHSPISKINSKLKSMRPSDVRVRKNQQLKTRSKFASTGPHTNSRSHTPKIEASGYDKERDGGQQAQKLLPAEMPRSKQMKMICS